MKSEILVAWIFLLICSEALSYYSCQSALTPGPGHNSMNTRAKQLQNIYESMVESRRKGDRRTLDEVKIKNIKRAGRGVYGGGDMNRPHSKPKNGATSLFFKSSTLLSAAFIHVLYNFG